MSHAIHLTEQATELLAGRNAAKELSRVIRCSYRTVQDWRARRRAMCLDHAIELAASNLEFHAALEARIEQARIINDAAQRTAKTAMGGQGAGVPGMGAAARESVRRHGEDLPGAASAEVTAWPARIPWWEGGPR